VATRELVKGYASALFSIAEAEGSLERVSDELFRFSRAMEQSGQLRSALTDIAVPSERKQAVVGEILGEKAHPLTSNLVNLLVSQGRARDVQGISEELARLTAESRSRVLAEVRSAVQLDEDTKDRLAKALERATGKMVDVKVIVDPSVVGGIYAKVGDQVIDDTVRTRLAELREELAKT
jgi:F-type H+-transporting ATPase subunit delta